MEYMNRYNLSPEVVAVLTKDYYEKDEDGKETDYSATTLVAPVQQTVLLRRYAGTGKLKVFDVIDRFWAFVGSIAHLVLEEHGHDDCIMEKRFYAKILGKTVSGKIDHYRDRIITDYKSTKAYKIQKGAFEDWEKQLNVYCYLCRVHGLRVDKLRIIAIVLDWKQYETSKRNYPQIPIVEIKLPLWREAHQLEYITERVRLLEENMLLPDDKLLPCTDEERWMDISTYSIMKKGAKRALRNFDTEKEALQYIEDKGIVDAECVIRKTAPKRCLEHCAAVSVCSQMKLWARIHGVEIPPDAPIF